MTEPVSTSAGAAAAGLFGLLVTIFGPLGGGVAAVAFASVSGVMLATAWVDKEPLAVTFWWVIVGLLVALVVAWPLVPVVAEKVPQIQTDHLPSMIGLASGVATRFSPRLVPLVWRWVTKRFGGEA